MKRVLLVISILLSFSMFCACSSDDEDLSSEERQIDKDAYEVAQASLIGKWKLVEQYGGKIKLPDDEFYDVSKGTFAEFFDNGTVKYEIGIGTDNHHLIESQLILEKDWTISSDDGNITKMYGHIQFMIWGRGLYNEEPNRFQCVIEYDEMYLCPDEGAMYLMDPTMKFIRVK
jgi:hypothetical protein